jgi:hypothetical protein
MERLSLRRSGVWLLSLAVAAILIGSDTSMAQFGPKPPRPIGGNPGGVRMAWRCGNCKRELADGLLADSCPFCGVRFRGGLGGFGGNAAPLPVADNSASGALCILFPVVVLVLAGVVITVVLVATMGGNAKRNQRVPSEPRRPRWRRIPDEPVWEPQAIDDEPIYEARLADEEDLRRKRRRY